MAKHRKRRRHGRRFNRRTAPGAAPGVVKVDERSPGPVIRAISFDADEVEQHEAADLEQAISLRGERRVLWILVEGLGDGSVIRRLGETFGLHPLALEDAVNVHQQVKAEDYRDHLFVVSRVLGGHAGLESQQLSIFLGADFVLTFAERPTRLLRLLQHRIDDADGRLRQGGCDFLAYAIIDTVLDEYFPLLEELGERLDDLDDLISARPPAQVVHDIHDVRVELRALRRIVWQYREAISILMRGSSSLVSESTQVFLRDCHDHTVQLVELLEVYHETCADLRDLHLSTVSNRLNEIMLVLTVIATIFIPLSFIASLYGMNFDPRSSPWNMPELTWYFGYPMALASMLAVALGLLLFFRRRGWIGAAPAKPWQS